MKQNGHVNFFDINKCGLYKVGHKDADYLNLNEVLHKIKSWVENRDFPSTNPWEKNKKNKIPCYCYQIHHDELTDDFLFILWKGESDENGPLYGITVNENGTINKTIEQTKTKTNKETIWGRPCYYWFITELNVLASIKFINSRTDSQMLHDWIKGCINLRIDLDGFKKKTTEKGYIKYEISDTTIQTNSLSYQFSASMKTLPSCVLNTEELAKTVTHVVYRETVSIKNVNRKKGLFQQINKLKTKRKKDSRKVEVRFEDKLSATEISDLIALNAETHQPGQWDDIGFIVDSSNNKIIWASEYRLTQLISIEDNNEPVIPASSLYATIKRSRDNYLAPIIKDLKSLQVAVNDN